MSSPPSVESHESAATKHLAPALEARRGTAMCLSDGGYSKEFAESVIAKIRTDMDAFSDTEIAVLENHGYTLAEAAHKAYVRQAGAQVAPLTPPNQHWPGGQPDSVAFEDTLRAQLADSSHVHLFGH